MTAMRTTDVVALIARVAVRVAVLNMLASGAALAVGGGLPACTQNLNACSTSLTAAQNSFSMCSADLTACEDTLAVSQACGNGVIDEGEDCDQGNLGYARCEGLGFAAGVLKCGAGCLFDTSGCTAIRFVDNGDGTVTDLKNRLMWEKKTYGECASKAGDVVRCRTDADCDGPVAVCTCGSNGCAHFVGQAYTWNGDSQAFCENGSAPNGTVFTDFLDTLNGHAGCKSVDGYYIQDQPVQFARYCDWRLPSITELRTLVDDTRGYCAGGSGLCIDPSLGLTNEGPYWSSTEGRAFSSDAAAEFGAWTVSFVSGTSYSDCKNYTRYARAVRNVP